MHTDICAALACVTFFCSAVAATAQRELPLWQGKTPGAVANEPADHPTLTVYPAEGGTGAAIVVCPGGGYGMLAPHEGEPVARWLNTLGITAGVLKYRLGPRYHHPAELHDAQRAIRMLRARAAEFALDPHRIGILGFSAGGHLAATAATHFDAGDPTAHDPIERVSCRPDLAVLVYPVITMTGPFAHAGSRENLLGDHPSQELMDLLSNEKQVTKDTPPCFLMHTADDPGVPVENSLMFAEALRKAGVPFELHIYQHGPHGVGLATNDPVLSTWTTLCAGWLRMHKFAR